jgi:hypothetical protein
MEPPGRRLDSSMIDVALTGEDAGRRKETACQRRLPVSCFSGKLRV